jgi:hypothetical protein
MIHKQLLDDAQAAISRRITTSIAQGQLEVVFAAWLTPDVMPNVEVHKLINDIKLAENRTYRQVAALGMAGQITALPEDVTSVLTNDLGQLFGREPVVSGTPMPFCMDGLALAGIMLGTHLLRDDAIMTKATAWFSRCCKVTAEGRGLEEWQEWLLRLVGRQTSLSWGGQRSWSETASVVSVALRSKGVAISQSVEAEESEEENALRIIQAPLPSDVPLGDAVLRLAALNWIRRIRPIADLRAASVDDLVHVLRRVPDGLKSWTWEDKPRTKTSPEARRWHVDNEYHVQNILWLVLAPIFPDLVPEDYTPKVGPVQPRADIGIPSLRIIVEVKFMRSTDAPKKMIEQIGQDASLYLVTGSRYDRIVPFIWDDSRRSEQHEDMLRGLRQIRGIVDAVIISRPGAMVTSLEYPGMAERM